MPQPRKHGGAELVPIQLTVPGFKGLNTQQAAGILGPEWATVLKNAVIDSNNRLAARKGWDDQTSSAATAPFVQIAEYLTNTGTSHLVGTTATQVFSSLDNGQTWSDVTGTASFSSGNWQMMMFNETLLGFQAGQAMLVYDGANCSQLSEASMPLGGIGLCAFGRVWVVDEDGVTVKYSGLLDHTDWSSDDSGQIQVQNVWPNTDTVQALAAFNGTLVAFGKDNILIWSDGQGSAVGIDPIQVYVIDTLSGVGCRARDSVQNVNGDIWFLSEQGLQSLARVVQQKSNPLQNLSYNVQDDLLATSDATVSADVRSVFSPRDRLYLLSFPRAVGGSEVGTTYAFDTRGLLEDQSARCLGKWSQLVPTAVARKQETGTLYIALRAHEGHVGTYDSRLDGDNSFPFEYQSGWLDLTQQAYLLIPKRINALFYLDRSLIVNIKWAFDFSTTFQSQAFTFEATAPSQYGIAQYGLGQYGAGVSLIEAKSQTTRTGEYIKLGISAVIDDTIMSLQQLELFAKIGRYK